MPPLPGRSVRVDPMLEDEVRLVGQIVSVAILVVYVMIVTSSLWLPWWREYRTYRYLRRQLRRRQ